MKQQITKEQWDEIGDNSSISEKQEKFVDTVTQIGLTLPTIGQMIEFLGDDWAEGIKYSFEDWEVSHIETKNDELCDLLWESVKSSLDK